jgi:hypothetical protein
LEVSHILEGAVLKQIAGLGLLVSVLSACSGAESLELVTFVDGFAGPESAAFDAVTDSWYISNIAGAEPGDGFISRLSHDGDVTAHRLISGLNEPKGIRIHRGVLYVSDVTRVVRVDLAHADNPAFIDVPGAVFLNDVAVDGHTGDVYVTDTIGNAVYRARGTQVDLVLQDPQLESPNGVLFDRGSLLIASVGPDLDPVTFQTSAPGRVQRLDLETLELTAVSERLGLLDGLERDRVDLLVSDFSIGVYRASPGEEAQLVLDNAEYGLSSSADIGFDAHRRRLAVPELLGTRVGLFDFEPTPFGR